MASETYEEYVQEYVETVRPQTRQLRPLRPDGRRLPAAGLLPEPGVVRAAALRHKLPFWNIVLSNAHFSYAEPTAGLRFQVYTTLAYGGRGIS